MADKNKSIFKKIMDSVFPWFKSSDTVSNNKKQKKKEKTRSSAKTVSDNKPDSFKNISVEEFEKFVHDIFIQRGYSVAAKQSGAYDGADLVLQRNNESTYVQYQDWKEQEVDVTSLGELYVAMEFDGVKHGIVVTTGEFTSEALDFSLGKSLMLINGIDLSNMIDALPSEEEIKQRQLEEKIQASTEPDIQEMPELDPLCPICSQKMIKRTAKKGKNAGNTFWGCSKFPGCRGVVSTGDN
jgi:restriction system protein